MSWSGYEASELGRDDPHWTGEPAGPEADLERVVAEVVADYDRRRSHWWGRFLLWLLRKTT